MLTRSSIIPSWLTEYSIGGRDTNALVFSYWRQVADCRLLYGSNRQRMTLHAGYAASRISSNLKGSTKQFGWLQALATNERHCRNAVASAFLQNRRGPKRLSAPRPSGVHPVEGAVVEDAQLPLRAHCSLLQTVDSSCRS